jgi:CheY-like chemotaxis protein
MGNERILMVDDNPANLKLVSDLVWSVYRISKAMDKRDPKTQHIAIIVIAAYPERYRREQAMGAGCDAYIAKPINTRQLSQQARMQSNERNRRKLTKYESADS